MIPRYDRSEISSIWSESQKFQYYLDVELALIKALETKSIAPKGSAEAIKKSVEINPQRVREIEAVVHHDIIAFCTMITEQLDPKHARFFHYGVTSSDIIDTAITLQIRESLKLIIDQFNTFLSSIKKVVEKTSNILAMGRSHGIFAEPLIFGSKFLSFYTESLRNFNTLKNLYENELTAQFSGAVGSYTIIDQEIESYAAKTLDLKVEDISTQIIPRDRIARIVNCISISATSIERMAIEIRHLQHSDVGEVFEGFSKGQKGSSTMPHKKNPISSENLTGMARMLRSYSQIAMENILLWHERDISHSSTERLYLPDCFGLFYYSLKRMSGVLNNLVVKTEVIENKVKNNSMYLSSFYLHHLLVNTDERREDLYRAVQEASFKVMETNEDLYDILKKSFPNSKLPQMNFEKLKDHYKLRFEKTLERVFI